MAFSNAGTPNLSRLFLTTGIIGGFTTFSTFSLEAESLYERGELLKAAPYLIGSVVLSVAAFPLRLYVVRSS
ncbi:fluoride ion exporter CrcB/FEX [Rhodoligotrophos appendicifer]|uniref:CrcB family protein n=1 Tax=Rhodoligotrophos appendicifer TaxID=987056 RepID=UPI001FECCDDF|nr:CrcB family protein [Rhodoligotrophos appendicifer]